MIQPHPTLKRDPGRRAALDQLRDHCLAERRGVGELASDDSHLYRVTRLALALAQEWAQLEEMRLDLDVLEAACWLHESGAGLQDEGETVAQASARLADESLRNAGLDELVWPVCELLLTNDPAAGRIPEAPAGQLLHDASLLDELGAFGLLRTMITSSPQPPRMHHLEDPGASDRTTEPEIFILDKILDRLLSTPGKMLTPVGEQLAKARLEWLHGMYLAMVLEASGQSSSGEGKK